MGLVVGIDLGHMDSQICYYESSMKEPETISVLTGAEKFKIPTVLCKQNGRDYFAYGEEAKRMALRGEGVLIVDLLENALEKESIRIGEEAYQTFQLLVIFLRKLWNSLVRIIGDRAVDRCVITVEETDKKRIELLEAVIQFLPLDSEQIFIQNHAESFYYYSLLQNKKLSDNQEMVLFEYKKDVLEIIELKIVGKKGRTVKKTRDFCPIINEFGEIMEKEALDRQFFLILQEEFQGKNIAFVYLIGDLFAREWMTDSLGFLCSGRRVFQGSNLYVKGSAVAAMADLEQWHKPYLYLGEHCLVWEYGIFMDEEKEEFLTLVKSGQSWFQAEANVELVLEDTYILEIVARSEDGNLCAAYPIQLGDLGARKHFVTAVDLKIRFEGPKKAVIQVTDLGFGETTASSGKVWTKVVEEWEE